MRLAAQTFIDALAPGQRALARVDFNAPDRRTFAYHHAAHGH